MNNKCLVILCLSLLLLIQGCLSFFTPEAYITPSRTLREIEAKYGQWYLLISNKNNSIDTIAARIYTTETLILFKGVYRLAKSNTREELLILEDSVPKEFKKLIYSPAISVTEHTKGREYLNLTTKDKILSFGAYLNIDKIFSDNKWCKNIIFDDLSEGYFFNRGNDAFMSLSYNDYFYLIEHKIISEERDYHSLILRFKSISGVVSPKN